MRRAVNEFNRERGFSSTNVKEKLFTFNKSALKVLNNFIPLQIILCLTLGLSLFYKSKIVFKNYREGKTNIELLNKLNFLQEPLNVMI